MDGSEDLRQKVTDALRSVTTVIQDLLPPLLAKKESLVAELNEINEQINALESVVNISGAKTPVIQQVPQEPKERNEPKQTPSGRSSPGVIEERIDAVMKSSPHPMQSGEIRRRINNEYGIEYASSSIYANLKRGEESGKYINDNGRWSMK